MGSPVSQLSPLVGLPLQVTVLSDCVGDIDRNAEVRMSSQLWVHLGAMANFVPLPYGAGSDAVALTFLDLLDTSHNLSELKSLGRSAILGNSSPRQETLSDHAHGPNGRPFFWAEVGGVIVHMTYDPELLSLAHRLGVISAVQMLDTQEVLDWAVREGHIKGEAADIMANSQFRGATLMPFVTRLLFEFGAEVPSTWHSLGEPMPAQGKVARIDRFGNVYTDALPDDVGFEPGGHLLLVDGHTATCYERLADVPADGRLAAVLSSSGFGSDRFIMICHQGGSAADELMVPVGSQIFEPEQLSRP